MDMRRLAWAAIGVALISMVFDGCKEEEPTYTVQITATEGGTVEGQNGKYKEGETVVFTAVPADGYYFSKWSDGNTDNPRAITVYPHDISLTAKFVSISVIAKEYGTVETQENGNTFVFTAVPVYGYYFSQWNDGNTDNPRTIIIGDADITLTAEFVLPTIETVDLGLESGNLWATCNVGAINPWNYGNYYAWGETETKSNYSWETYKYCKDGDSHKLTKYNTQEDRGPVDNKTTLEPSDDVAAAVFGAEYSIPTYNEWFELDDQCYWVWTSNYNKHNVSGHIIYRAKNDADKGKIVNEGETPSASYSLSDAHIFLPAAGCRDKLGLYFDGSCGYYQSTSLYYHPYEADAYICHYVNGNYMDDLARFVGFSVRPVRRP